MTDGTNVDPRRQRVLDHAAGVWSASSRYAAVLVLLVCIFVVLSLTQENFFTRPNIENLLTSVSILFVVSMGMTFVVLTAGIDLSVGSTLALMGILLSHLFNNVGLPAWLAVLLTLVAGALLGGLVNGVLIGKVGLSFFVVTLGTLSLYQGIVNIWSGTETTYITSSFIDWFGFGTVLGIPSPIWIMLATYLIAFVVLRWTYFGRDVYAVGGNIEAARLSGINVSRTLIFVYGISGLAAALGGVIQAGRLGAASPIVGQSIPLDAAAAVLLGGTSFLGGVGGVTGTAVGVLFIGTLQNGLSISGVSSFWQQVVTGVILIVAVAIDRLQQNRGGRFRRVGAPRVMGRRRRRSRWPKQSDGALAGVLEDVRRRQRRERHDRDHRVDARRLRERRRVADPDAVDVVEPSSAVGDGRRRVSSHACAAHLVRRVGDRLAASPRSATGRERPRTAPRRGSSEVPADRT